MKPITIRSNWGYFDQLDDVDLAEGEHLRIEWPDGTRTEEYVHIDGRDVELTKDTINIRRAYVATYVRGVPVRIYLTGDKTAPVVLAERIPKSG